MFVFECVYSVSVCVDMFVFECVCVKSSPIYYTLIILHRALQLATKGSLI